MKIESKLGTIARLLPFVLPSFASATAQVPDVIVINGHDEPLQTNPLVHFLAEHPDTVLMRGMHSSANWRGYVATWEVSNSTLLLRKVDVEIRDPKSSDNEFKTIERNVIADLFPDASHVVASWYSGALVIPRGKQVAYVHMGYGSTYERYTLLKVK